MSDYFQDDLPLFRKTTPTAAPLEELTEGCKSDILSRLKRGPATCRQIDRLTHARGQALVHAMREDGFDIRTEMVSDKRCYVYYGFEKRARCTPAMQEAYYDSAHWQSTARERKCIDNWTCQQCGSEDTTDDERRLEAHHWVYNLFAEDVERELITLCKVCHESVHFWIKGGACHFPRHVGETIAIQLGWDPE